MSKSVGMFVLLATAMAAAACGSESTSASAGREGMEVSITTPEDGAEVTTPFTVEVSSSEELGPEETGENHVHVFFDGHEDDYLVVTSESAEIDELAPGDHTIGVSLRNADHSPAGAEAEISVTVSGGRSTGTEEPDETGDDYDY
jgi:hypothetical protein